MYKVVNDCKENKTLLDWLGSSSSTRDTWDKILRINEDVRKSNKSSSEISWKSNQKWKRIHAKEFINGSNNHKRNTKSKE